MTFLLKFLDLPTSPRPLETMSGGQQRRASLAVALLHRPELLILDEPTVGVDPLLRQGIWAHLVELATSSPPTTVLVTTHYTEEALQAHTVGMMRGGRLLAEGSPQALLQQHDKISLEEVFLKLCMGDREEVQEVVVVEKAKEAQEASEVSSVDPLLEPQEGKKLNVKDSKGGLDFSPRIMAACMGKTFMRMRKRWGFLIYTFLLPALQVSLFCLAVGRDPKGLSLAVVTGEAGQQCHHSMDCPVDLNIFNIPSANDHWANMSCRFLSFLESSVVSPVMVATPEEAVAKVESGEAWGSLIMDANFSEGLHKKVFDSLTCLDPLECAATTSGNVRVRLDVTNQQLALTLQLKLVEAFQDFIDQMVDSCSLPRDIASLPIVFERPVYGSSELTFTDFMVPGIILTIVHSMALAFSAMVIIIERNEGLVERTWVAGVSSSESSLAHFLCSSAINLVQV